MHRRVLHILKSSELAGAQRHLVTLLPALTADGTQVRVLVAATGEAERFCSPLRESGVDVRTTPAGPDLNPHLYWRIVREIRDFRPTLIHTHLVHGDVHGQVAASRANVPAISTMHSTHDFYRQRPYRRLLRNVSQRAARTIAISEWVRRFAEELALNSPDALRVVHYGIDLDEWDTGKPGRDSARRQFGMAKNEVTFGIASRLIPDKGHALLIDAFVQALDAAPKARLLVAGDGPLRSELEARARARSERITFLGFVEDIRAFLCACDVLVFPTLPELGEGFGLASLEAMACSVPVIATRVGALPEVVADGATGLVVSPDGPTELASAIARLAASDSERIEMGRRGRLRAEQHFAASLMVDRTRAVYDEITG